MFLSATRLIDISASQFQIEQSDSPIVQQTLGEVHHVGPQDVPAVRTILEDHSDLHSAHIDRTESLGVFDQDIGE